MSSNQQYETGPSLEDEREPDESEDGGDGGNGDDPTDGPRRRRRKLAVSPWKAGLASGVSAFAVVYAVAYHFVSVLIAVSGTGADDEPSRWILAGLVTLGSHGAPIEQGGESIGFGFRMGQGFLSHVTALVPVVVLLVAGYLLVRSVRLETRSDAGLALGSFGLSYLAIAVGLSLIATWTPEGTNPEPITVPTDVSFFLTIGGTVVVFVAIGAAVAAVPRLLADDR
ncbi:hypothetical protein [Natrinema versiforme]|uniref:DUF7978 domain-containing protein n=1 Tax=Natrinema versiforme TaxID=88724 RepID=A0A4V1FX92_9EURY|nr:hypothetical protein [Natrinema versiforme]QCS40893.1 hypothetical protein FEJ81_00495 [Natrinema versiforme]